MDVHNDPRPLVLVGLMGAGKSTVGRRLAAALSLPFADADAEIEKAAGMPVTELFQRYGEPAFREGERKVIRRLLAGPRLVIATGGGAFMNAETRALIKQVAVSIWLKADLDLLMKRVARRNTRPLLAVPDPRAVMARLMEERYPVYAEADLTVMSDKGPHEQVVDRVLAALRHHAPADAPPADGVRP